MSNKIIEDFLSLLDRSQKENLKSQAMESGMNAHLAKPLDTPKLYKLLRQFLQEG